MEMSFGGFVYVEFITIYTRVVNIFSIDRSTIAVARVVSWSDAKWGNTNLKKGSIFSNKIWARGDAESYLHGTTLTDFTIFCS